MKIAPDISIEAKHTYSAIISDILYNKNNPFIDAQRLISLKRINLILGKQIISKEKVFDIFRELRMSSVLIDESTKTEIFSLISSFLIENDNEGIYINYSIHSRMYDMVINENRLLELLSIIRKE